MPILAAFWASVSDDLVAIVGPRPFPATMIMYPIGREAEEAAARLLAQGVIVPVDGGYRLAMPQPAPRALPSPKGAA